MLEQMLTGALLATPISAENAAPDITEEDLNCIRALRNPPLTPLTADALYVRRCRLAGDAIDAKGGRFRTSDLPKLLELVQGAPTLIGHDRSRLAVARFFGGTIETHENVSYIVPKLYWLKGHSRAEDLRLEIDGGLVNEASIAFLFKTPTCSVCGKDIRECPHEPGKTYGSELCCYYYDGITAVTEGSLVYRGAEPGTGLLPNALTPSAPWFGDDSATPPVKFRGSWWRLVPLI